MPNSQFILRREGGRAHIDYEKGKITKINRASNKVIIDRGTERNFPEQAPQYLEEGDSVGIITTQETGENGVQRPYQQVVCGEIVAGWFEEDLRKHYTEMLKHIDYLPKLEELARTVEERLEDLTLIEEEKIGIRISASSIFSDDFLSRSEINYEYVEGKRADLFIFLNKKDIFPLFGEWMSYLVKYHEEMNLDPVIEVRENDERNPFIEEQPVTYLVFDDGLRPGKMPSV